MFIGLIVDILFEKEGLIMENFKLEILEASVQAIAEAAGKMLADRHGWIREDAEIVDRKQFTTKSDLLSHGLIARKLQNLTPNIMVYSEEDNVDLAKTNDWLWVIDPLDGTINFFHELCEWGVSIALVHNQKTELGTVFIPQDWFMFSARANSPVIKPIRAELYKNTDLALAQIWTDHIKGPADPVIEIFGKLTRHTLCPQVRLCCTASMMAVAMGKIAGYVHPAPKPEDFAAAALIVEKAGGRVTDLQGNDWNLFSKSIVATNGLLHDELLNVLNS